MWRVYIGFRAFGFKTLLVGALDETCNCTWPLEQHVAGTDGHITIEAHTVTLASLGSTTVHLAERRAHHCEHYKEIFRAATEDEVAGEPERGSSGGGC